jgi:hypothetical protein
MGVNAQIEVPAFTAGQVLTAAEMTQINTGIPVFATTVTRDAAFGGAGEKVLAEGQFAYIEATNTTQYYDGAAWQSVGVTPGLVRVGGASFSAVSSVAFANSTFTSTYNVYLVVMNITATSTPQNLSLRVRDNGGSKSGANYFGQAYYIRNTGTLSSYNTGSATSQILGRAYTTLANNAVQVSLYVANPASATSSTTWWGQGTLKDSGDEVATTTIMGTYSTAEAHTGLEFFVGGTITGNYNVYALAES